jgi:hypothetical protein
MPIYEKDHYLKEEQMFKNIFKTKAQKEHELYMKELDRKAAWQEYTYNIISEISRNGQTW